MSQQKLLNDVVTALDSCNVSYMVTGSIASSLFGEPRSTHDIDLVVEFDRQHIDALLEYFPPPSYYLDRKAIANAISHSSMFNLLWVDEGVKVDFWLLTDSPFDGSRFDRRLSKSVWGVDVWIASPEDTILAKLRWADMSGGSEKQMTDAKRVLEVQRSEIDEDYIREWADELGLAQLWQELVESAEDIDTK